MKNKILKTIPIIAALALFIGCSTKAPVVPKDIQKSDYTYLKEYMDWFIEKEMKDKDIVGLSIALVDDQKIVWQKGFGYADKKQKSKATPTTKYRAGSISKVFNAMAVMKLVESGKMDIDKPLKTYLKEFSIKSRFGSTDGITPRSIMTHHSGIPAGWVDGMFAKNPLPYTEHVHLIKDEYVAYPPNKIMSYSNLAMTLLGDAVEKVNGKKYSEFLKDSLLNPLGMVDSDFEMALSGREVSKAYSQGKETIEYPLGMIPAGALNTTARDLSKLAMIVNNEGKLDGKTILEADTLKEMFKVQNENIPLDLGEKIGLGWFINDSVLQDEMVYGHDGATIAHRSSFLVAPKSKLGVVVLTNSDSADSVKIADMLLQKAWEAKTGKKLSHKKVFISTDSDFQGTYATMLGKVDVAKKSNEHYIAKTALGNFGLKKQDNGTYTIKYLLFNFIPIGDSELDSIGLYTKEIDNEHLAIAQIKNYKFLVGTKVEPKPISKAWRNRLGSYQILNQLKPKAFQIKELKLMIKNDFLILETTMLNGEKNPAILQVINDTEAIMEGLGRGTRETMRVENGVLVYSGLRFKIKL